MRSSRTIRDFLRSSANSASGSRRVDDIKTGSSHELDQQSRELDCLYAISSLASGEYGSSSEVLQKAVDLIPDACECQDSCCARIVIGDREFRSRNFTGTAWKLSSDIVALGAVVGTVELCNLKNESDVGPLPAGKRNVISAIAEQLGRIVEREKTQDRLRRMELEHRAFLENLPEGFVIIDTATLKVGLANGRAADLLGVRSADDLVGWAWLDVVHPEDRIHFEELASKETGDELQQAQAVREFRIVPPGGGETWVRAREVRTEFRGKQSTLIFLTRIAEQERVEDKIQKLSEEFDQRVSERTTQLEVVNKELEAFAYSVSHDLRAPLRSIEGFSQILLEDYAHWLDTQGRDYIQRIRSAARRMAQLVDDLLNFSRVTRSEMVRDAVDLTAAAQAIVTELRQGQPERQAEFIIAPNLKSNGDARLLRLALDNLIGNAWKFTRKRPRTRIEFGSTQADGQTAYFVRDNGVGFDMAYADKLFDGFQRLHSPAEYEGTGIGLTTVQRIIARHGGRIWADSAVDQGATFYFTLSAEEGVR